VPPPTGAPPVCAPPPPPAERTRAALWRVAGPARDGAGLERLTEDPYPLARLIARSALARSESRGCHVRTDHPGVDPALDGSHTIVDARGVRREAWT
jgi:L-aspartate oxidase